jgi:hypothetical protein
MTERPLLLFPTPEIADRTKGRPFFGKVHRPSVNRQGVRLSTKLQQLQRSFDSRNVELQQTPAGIDPEQVLVIETVGSIDNFANAVKRIAGLDWMGEIEIDEIKPDEDFYDEEKPDKELSGRLYLVMTNQTALSQMLSLWKQYQETPDMVFGYGLTKFRDVFLHLKDIRRWGVKDRLAESGVIENWRESLVSDPNTKVRFEAELWYRKTDEKRIESGDIVKELILQLGGNIKSQSVIQSIAYHSILGEIPAVSAAQIIQQPEVDLIKCDNIMFFRPTGQMATGREPAEGDFGSATVQESPLPVGDPLVAVLDGMPLENHAFLAGRLIVDDPDDWAPQYPAIDRQHGTAMTSLIVHGDLNSNNSVPLNRPVYIRPILKPIPWYSSPRPEQTPEDILFVDYIHQAVRRIMEGTNENEAVAPTVKIINFSIGDLSRQFIQTMSPLARLLDWLSAKYMILFVISSGNHREQIETGLTTRGFENLTPAERERLVVRKIYENVRNRRLLSPAESINGLTVGAHHYDESVGFRIGHSVNVFSSDLPSPVSAFGSGYRRSIKPDLLHMGGRVLYNWSFGSGNKSLQFADRREAPGNKVASPTTQTGELDKIRFCCGSSNSAALISRAASICYDAFSELFKEQAPDVDFDIFSIPLLKAMLVHGCSWDDFGSNLDSSLRSPHNSRQMRSWISRWLGYGCFDGENIFSCTEERASLIGFGQLNDEEAHMYILPLPPSLNAKREWRKLTVTLAWLSPIVPTTQKYRGAQLWFDFEGGNKSREKLKGKLRVVGIDSDSSATKRGTVQHEIFEGDSAVTISDDDVLRIKVNCRKDAQKIGSPIAYGLVVSLEVAEGVDIHVYDEIRNRIIPAVEIRPRG